MHSRDTDRISASLASSIAPDPTEPPAAAPTGPRRIHAHQRHPWRQAKAAGLGLLAGLGTALLAASTQPGDGLPQALRLPQPPDAMPAETLLLPLLLAGAAWIATWRLGAWALPLLMAGLVAGTGLPLLLSHADLPAGWMTSPAILTALALPGMALLVSRPLLGRLGLTGRFRRWRDLAFLPLFAGLAAPALGAGLAWGVQLAAGVPAAAAATAALTLAQAWALGLVCAGTVLKASSEPPARGMGWLAALLSVAALSMQLAALRLPANSVWLLLPHLLLSLHALQASQRHNALLAGALLLIWAGTAPASLTSGLLGAGLALLPLAVIALSQPSRREQDGWRGALDAHGLAMAKWRLPGGQLRASARWLALTTPPDGSTATGDSPLDWVRRAHPRDRDRVRRAVRGLLGGATASPLSLQLRLAADGGDWRWHELQAHVSQRDRAGQARSVFMTLADVSWRHTAAERERMTATLFQHVEAGLAVVDMHWRIVEVNPAYCEILREPREALVGRTATPLSAANLRANGHEPADLQARLTRGEAWSGQLQISRPAGGQHTLAVKLSPVPEPGEASPRWRLLSVNDLSDTLQQQDLLRRTLRSDTATGLPNREEFMRLLQQAMAGIAADGFKLVVCMIDLDDFGRVNAEHGQLVADAVLLQLSARLRSTLRSNRGAVAHGADQIARLHGDEFAVVIRVQAAEEAQHAVERLLNVLATPVAIRESHIGDGLALEIGASLGATVYPTDDSDPETLLRHAGHALYRAKHAGRGGFQFYDPTTHQRDEAGLIAQARLQRALDTDELVLHYQPQIDLRTGQTVGVEALLRWQHPERGLLAPAHFLPLVEATGLAVQIGDWVIEQALGQAGRWAREGLNGGKGLPVSVNVGARQLRSHDFPQRLQELIQRQPPDVAALLHLDVLEADALAETAAAQALIQRCLSLGVGIALDDFGAGYSRLAALKRLPVDTLKLDRSFVQGMLGDAQDLSLVESVIQLARNIGCNVLAKGVESRAHARELLRLGCRLGQGNGIAAAMAPSALPGWIDGFALGDWPSQLGAATARPLT